MDSGPSACFLPAMSVSPVGAGRGDVFVDAALCRCVPAVGRAALFRFGRFGHGARTAAGSPGQGVDVDSAKHVEHVFCGVSSRRRASARSANTLPKASRDAVILVEGRECLMLAELSALRIAFSLGQTVDRLGRVAGGHPEQRLEIQS